LRDDRNTPAMLNVREYDLSALRERARYVT